MGNLFEPMLLRHCLPDGIRAKFRNPHDLRRNFHDATDPTHIRINLLPMDRHQRERSPCGEHQFLNVLKAYPWLPWPLLTTRSQRLFHEWPIWIRAKLAYVRDAEALKAVIPDSVTHQCQQKELRAHIQHVS